MKFNPLSNRLFTDDGRLIKRLHCPVRVDWSGLRPGSDHSSRCCDVCRHQITDTALFTDEQILTILADNPEACLKVNLAQNNLTIICHDEESC